MEIIISRIDPLGGIPDPDQHGEILSVDKIGSWDGAVAVLGRYGIDTLTPQQLADFHAESPAEDITFQHREFINAFTAAYSCNVHYIISVSDTASPN